MNARSVRNGTALVAFAFALFACSEDTGASAAAPADAGPSDEAAPPEVVGARPDAEPKPRIGTLDRVGKAYVSLILVSSANRHDYNLAPVQEVYPTDPTGRDGGRSFGADFQSTLVKLDAIDGTSQWAGGSEDAEPDDAGAYPHPLANAWVSGDALIVDPNKPFSKTGYLDVEIDPAAATTCGGRWLNDDALDKTLSFLVTRSRTGVSDGVAGPARRASTKFPYVAPPF